MRCPECGTETDEFNGGQYCPECGVYVIPPSPIDARALPEFRELLRPFAHKIVGIPNKEARSSRTEALRERLFSEIGFTPEDAAKKLDELRRIIDEPDEEA
jgi:hypothetical protein